MLQKRDGHRPSLFTFNAATSLVGYGFQISAVYADGVERALLGESQAYE